MGTYMGNVGHLLQHWTLCEILAAALPHCSGLNYIDAHAMAPWATQCAGPNGEPREPDVIFRSVKDDLHLRGSHYEQAWDQLWDRKGPDGYPSSAAFVRKIWSDYGPYSVLLCEIDPGAADAISQWIRPGEGCLFRGDWLQRFGQERGLPGPSDADLEAGSLTLVSFDPDMYDRRRLIQRNGDRNPETFTQKTLP